MLLLMLLDRRGYCEEPYACYHSDSYYHTYTHPVLVVGKVSLPTESVLVSGSVQQIYQY